MFSSKRLVASASEISAQRVQLVSEHVAHGFDHQVRGAALRDVATCAGADGLDGIADGRMHAEDEDARGRIGLPDLPNGIDAAATRHADVHDHHIRRGCPKPDVGRCRVLGLGDDLDVRLLLKQAPIPFPNDGMVVDHHHANALPGHDTPLISNAVGKLTRNRNPAAGLDSVVISPLSA